MRRPGLWAGVALALAGCGGGPAPAPPCPARPPPESTAWLGARPGDPAAAAAFEAATALFARGKEEEEYREVGLLAFHPETVPALLTFMEKGCDLQVRAAFQGLAGLVEGTMFRWYFPDPGTAPDREGLKARILPLLAAPATRPRLAAALERLPEAARKGAAQTLAGIPPAP